MLSSVDLPQPEWPMIETYSPLSIVERDVLQHLGLGGAAGEGLVDVIELQIGRHDAIALQFGGGAAGDDLGDAGDDAVEHEADDADIEQRQDDFADVRGVPGVPDEEADADAADQHFRRDDREPGQADADAQAGEDVGRRRRHHDLAEELERD